MIQKEKKDLAYFEFKGSGKSELFVFQLRDPSKIAHARAILSGEETVKIHPKGIIVKEAAKYNPKWSYHLDPDSVTFFSVSMEVCDANMRYVEEHLSEVGGAALPDSIWCPWSSKLTRELFF